MAAPEELAAHREAVRDLLARLLKKHSVAKDLVQEARIHATHVAKGMRDESAPQHQCTAGSSRGKT